MCKANDLQNKIKKKNDSYSKFRVSKQNKDKYKAYWWVAHVLLWKMHLLLHNHEEQFPKCSSL